MLQFSSFKTHFMEIQLCFVTLRKILENSVQFLQFYDTFTQKYHIYRQISRYLCNIKML